MTKSSKSKGTKKQVEVAWYRSRILLLQPPFKKLRILSEYSSAPSKDVFKVAVLGFGPVFDVQYCRPSLWMCDGILITFEDPQHVRAILSHYADSRTITVKTLTYDVRVIDPSFLVHYKPPIALNSLKSNSDKPNRPMSKGGSPTSAQSSKSPNLALAPSTPNFPQLHFAPSSKLASVLGKRKGVDSEQTLCSPTGSTSDILNVAKQISETPPTSPSLVAHAPSAKRRSHQLVEIPHPVAAQDQSSLPMLRVELASLRAKFLSIQLILDQRPLEKQSQEISDASRELLLEEQCRQDELNGRRRELENEYDAMSRDHEDEMDKRKDAEVLLKRLNRSLKARSAAAADANTSAGPSLLASQSGSIALISPSDEIDPESLRRRIREVEENTRATLVSSRVLEEQVFELDRQVKKLRDREVILKRIQTMSSRFKHLESLPTLATARYILSTSSVVDDQRDTTHRSSPRLAGQQSELASTCHFDPPLL